MNSLFGFETEYGIAVEGASAHDLISHSREVVKSFAQTGRAFAAPWNYKSEDPRADQRGFRAHALSVDPVDAQFDRPGERAASPEADRCDHVLENGARFYNDHGHPEYATPECADLRSLVAHDKAGELVALECAQIYAAKIGKSVQIFKNNTDFHGASYGSHESYLLRRGVSWDDVTRNLAPFLATRIVFCGAGKVGCEEKGVEVPFQISQRADFFQTLQSVDTLHNRPLVNTRDEPHADANKFRRLHVISGDANMSQWAIALRAGTTNLVAALVESGWSFPLELRDPVRAIKTLSRDQNFSWKIENTDAISVQRLYLDAAAKLDLPGSEWILAEWDEALRDLEADFWRLSDRADWVAKRALLEGFVEAENLDWTRDRETLQSLDLAYCNVDEAESLYGALVENGQMRELVSREEIEAAQTTPPENSRAKARGEFVKSRASEVARISWGAVELKNGQRLAFEI